MKTIKTKKNVGIGTMGVKPQVTKEFLIEKYFKPKNIFGSRKCKYISDFKINRRGVLLCRAWMSYEKVSWEFFHTALANYFNSKMKLNDEEDIPKYDWEFKNEK